jgi:hypothetical protein
MRRAIWGFVVLLAFVLVGSTATTSATALAYVYDGHRVNAPARVGTANEARRLDGARHASVGCGESNQLSLRATSLASIRFVVATEEVSGAVGRSASTEWGQTVQDFKASGDAWSRVSAHAEEATSRTYRGGLSIEEVFTRGDEWLVRHRIYDAAGNVVHETFRPYAKFGAP